MTELKRILVVDDNRDAADALAKVLCHCGHDAKVAYSGQAAVELARTQEPNVVLLDLAMPRMDGYKVAQAIRQELGMKDALIIAVTGYGLPGDRARSEAAEIDVHLLKLVDGHKLLKLIGADSVASR